MRHGVNFEAYRAVAEQGAQSRSHAQPAYMDLGPQILQGFVK